MDADTLAVLVLMPLSGLFICYLGYRIRYRRDLWLISGYRPGTASDETGLARFVGGVTLALGGLTALYGPLGLVAVQVFGRRYA